jgi:hypothetical protein
MKKSFCEICINYDCLFVIFSLKGHSTLGEYAESAENSALFMIATRPSTLSTCASEPMLGRIVAGM